MNFIIKNSKWIMLVSGVLTCTTFYGLFAPQAALESMFGASFDGTLETMIIRSWSVLVGLMGVMLIYGGISEKHRVYSISIAALSKLAFVSLFLLYGQAFFSAAAAAIIMDILVIIVAVVYLIAVRVQQVKKR